MCFLPVILTRLMSALCQTAADLHIWWTPYAKPKQSHFCGENAIRIGLYHGTKEIPWAKCLALLFFFESNPQSREMLRVLNLLPIQQEQKP